MISKKDNARSLYDKTVSTALSQIEDFIPKLEDGSYVRVPQDHISSNVWRKRSVADGKIDCRMTSRSICNLIRALTKPYVGAHVIFHGKSYKVWEAFEEKGHLNMNIEPGKIISFKDTILVVKTGDGAVALTKHELDHEVEAGDYLS